MSLKNNLDEPIKLPTISSFIKFLCKVLDVDTAQSKEVIQGRTIKSKLSRFNDDYLLKITNSLAGVDILPSDWKISNDNDLILNCYKRLLEESFEFYETILSIGHNQFTFQNLRKEQLVKDYIYYFIVSYIDAIHSQFGELPLFVPITQLSEIATKLFINSDKDPSSIIINHLREKYHAMKIKGVTLDIYIKLSHINEKEIIKTKNLADQIQDFFNDAEVRKKQNTSELEAFIGSYRCCIILLRLKRELGDDIFNFLIRTTIIKTLNNQYISEKSEDKPKDKPLLFINRQYFKSIKKDISNEEFANYYDEFKDFRLVYNYFLAYMMTKNQLSSPDDLRIRKENIEKIQLNLHLNLNHIYDSTVIPSNELEFLNFCFENFVMEVLSIFEKFSHFKHDKNSPEYNLLKNDIRSAFISNQKNKITKNYLRHLKDEIKTLNKPYKDAVIHYIDLLQKIIEGNISDSFVLAEKIINEDTGKWNLGKIKSDAFLIYITLGNLEKSFSRNNLHSILNKYAECQFPRLSFSSETLDESLSNIDEHIIRSHLKSVKEDFELFLGNLNSESDAIYEKLYTSLPLLKEIH